MTESTPKFWEFHPVVQAWFDDTYQDATECQKQAWEAIQKRNDVLVAAPTGSGKTLAAFLAAIDELVQTGISQGELAAETYILYVSPLKALSYDIERNLEAPLQGIRQRLVDAGYPDVHIRTAVRTGDTTQSERQKMARNPPHILVTTPESFYLLLTSESGRRMLQSVRRLVVDEIHALAGNKRGAHFSLSVARLERLVQRTPKKIGLSATQKPVELIASYLTGKQPHGCSVVDIGHVREWDLAIEIPAAPLEAVMSTESWQDIYRKIANLIQDHRTTLIFVNTRRHAERATRHLAELVGEENVGSHHGSLSKEHRHDAEQRLKSGSLRALVATASLELGIDIGDVDLVCQICSPRSITVFLQRIGRSGHSVGKTPKGRIFPTTRDELVESAALLKAINDGELETLQICGESLDVLAQQIVAESCVGDCEIDNLFDSFRGAYPYRNLQKSQFHTILQMLCEGFTLTRGRRGAYIHLDAVNKIIRGRRGARIVAATNAGAIPDLFDYDVILEPDDIRIGTVNEDFAFESLAGDIFQLGNASYRIRRVEKGYVRVEDAHGQPPNIPFWLGEGRGRSPVLSKAVSDLRQYVSANLDERDLSKAAERFAQDYRADHFIAMQIVEYLAAAKHALGVLPDNRNIVFERFFDETGDTHLVVHSVFGSRLNRAWGLALRKRFCVRFNFELQAAALEDNFVLSLGPTHSFALDEVQGYIKSSNVRTTLVQALLGAPMFATRWRWVANAALAVLRFRNGKKVPPPFQRNDSEDLLSLVFPAQVACQENITGPIEVPDHPLVQQTISDCLHEVMDVDGLEEILERIENKEISIVCRDLPEPSPLAHEVITAKPYAFLDDAPAEERRTLAVQSRRLFEISDANEIGRLDLGAIKLLQNQAWPNPRDAEELHDALVHFGFMRVDEANPRVEGTLFASELNNWQQIIEQLAQTQRVTKLITSNSVSLWVAAERLQEMLLLHPDSSISPQIEPATLNQKQIDNFEHSAISILRSRLEVIGPCTSNQIAASVDLSADSTEAALRALEVEGSAMRGNFTGIGTETEWCDRRFLARIHKQTIAGLRKEVKPVDKIQFTRYLTRWFRLNSETMGEGADALDAILEQMEGYESSAAVWESDVLPARVFGYTPELLDYLSASGRVMWCRLSKPDLSASNTKSKNRKYRFRSSIKTVPLTFLRRNRLSIWRALTEEKEPTEIEFSAAGHQISEALCDLGPMFFDEILEEINQLPSHVEEGLVELFAQGIVTCDHYGGIRALLKPESHRRKISRMRRVNNRSVQISGRWSLLANSARHSADSLSAEDINSYVAKVLLRRYGIVFRALLSKEGKFFPAWSGLIRTLRRMEDRGEVRGGRFVSEVAGEQFALPQAIELLRDTRNRKRDNKALTIHSSDPLNLTGIFSQDARVATLATNYLVYRDGELITVVESGERREVIPSP